jgi:hypothetical protein
MKEWDDKALERRMDLELKRLPDLPAPGTLLHRVMLAVHARERRPWYGRAWPTWPRPLQVVSIAVFGLLALTGVILGSNPGWLPGVTGLEWGLPEWTEGLSAVLRRVGTVFSAFGVVWRALGGPLLWLGLGLVLVAYASSVGLLSVCYRLAVRRA